MKILKCILWVVGIFWFSITHAQTPAYKNKTLSPELRAKDLLGRMTLDEKIMQTQCL